MRVKSIAWCVLTFIYMVAAVSGALAKEAVLSGAEVAYPPFSFVTEDGEATGFSVELMRAAMNAVDREVTFRTGSWGNVRGWLEEGQIDALPLVGRTPEREELFDFTFPYMSLHGAIVVREDEAGVEGLDDLRGRDVAVMEGDNAEEFLRREDRGLKIHATPTFQKALQNLSRGQYDAVFIQRLVAIRLLEKLDLPNVRVLDKPIREFKQEFCFAATEGDRETLALLNEGLSIVMADGTYRRLRAQWFGSERTFPQRHLVVGGDHNFPPFEFINDEGRPDGYSVDLIRAIAREMGLSVQIQLGPWEERRRALAEGEIDVLEGMFYSPERDIQFDFSAAHTTVHYVAVVREGDAAPPDTERDLAGLDIVVQNEDIMHDYLRERELQARITKTNSQEQALREVAEGKHDCALVARMTALYLRRKHGWDNLVVGEAPITSHEYSFAVPENQRVLLGTLNAGLQRIEENGEYRRIYNKWFGIEKQRGLSMRTVLEYSAMVLGPLVLILLAVLLWGITLRRKVKERTREVKKRVENLHQIEWMLSGKRPGVEDYTPGYGDLTERNEDGLIMSRVGKERLREIASEYLDLLQTSAAIYERNGDYALGMFSSGWCKLMDAASRELCDTDDNREALQSGRWHCHESCWKDASVQCMESGELVDTPCRGGINLYAVPIRVHGSVVGALNFGYGDPPTDDDELEELSQRYELPVEKLREHAEAYQTRPEFIIEYAKKRARQAASRVGRIIEHAEAEEALENERAFLSAVFNNLREAIVICDENGRISRFNEAARQLHGLPEEPIPPEEWSDYYDLYRTDGVSPLAKDEIPLYRALRGEEFHDVEIVVAAGDNTPRTLACSGQPLIDETGDKKGAVVAMFDVTERKEAAEALRQSEQRFRILIEQAPLPIMVLAEDGEVLIINKAWTNITGYTSEDLATVDDWLKNAYDDEQREKVRERIGSLRSDGDRLDEAMFQISCKDGTERVWGFSSSVVGQTEDGRHQIISMARDVTKYRKAEKQIRRLNSLLMAIRNVNQIIVKEDDLDVLMQKICESLVETRSYRGIWTAIVERETQMMIPQGRAGETTLSLEQPFSPADSENIPECVGAALKSGNLEVRNAHEECSGCPDKSKNHDFMSACLPILHDDEVVGLLHIYRDKESPLDRQEELLLEEVAQDLGFARAKILADRDRERLVSHLEERVKETRCLYSVSQLVVDPELAVDELLSAAVERIPEGWQYLEEAGARIRCDENEYTSSQFRETPWMLSAELWVSGEVVGNVEVCYRSETWEANEDPFLDEERDLLQDLARQLGLAIQTRRTQTKLEETLKDLKKTQSQLVEQERRQALTQMASGIAHDFNNALSTIRGFTDLLLESEDKLRDKETATRYLEFVREAASNAAETVSRMRKFYRPAEEVTLKPENINRIVKQSVSMTRPYWKEEARAHGAEIEVEMDLGDVPLVEGDETELHEMLTNLIFNSVDAMPDGGRIVLKTRESNDEVVLEARDNGVGMSPQVCDHCLDPFYTTKQQSGGTGLGLSTVQGTVGRHNGRVTVESEEGEGTTFRIVLPVLEGAQMQEEVGEPSGIVQTLKILVVEDEVHQRELMTQYLKMDEHDVDTAPDGEEGLAAFEAHDYDVVLTDRSMPGMSGDDLARKIKKQDPERPIIMLTGFGTIMEAAGEKPDAVDAILSKPLTRAELRATIKDVVEDRGKHEV